LDFSFNESPSTIPGTDPRIEITELVILLSSKRNFEMKNTAGRDGSPPARSSRLKTAAGKIARPTGPA
jgi:hypothetical protein